MRRTTKILLSAVAVYCLLWAATFFAAAPTLTRQLHRELLPAWHEDQAAQKETRKKFPSMPELQVYREGPVARVKLLSCPAPFVFRAECGRSISGLNGYGAIGYYLLTPWRVYVLSEHHTWVS